MNIESEIRDALKERGWSPLAIISTIHALEDFDGPWSWGTTRMVRDLAEIYTDLESRCGEPPDGSW